MIRKITRPEGKIFSLETGTTKKKEVKVEETSRRFGVERVIKDTMKELNDKLLPELLEVLDSFIMCSPSEVYRNPYLSRLSREKESLTEVKESQRYTQVFLNSLYSLQRDYEEVVEEVEGNLLKRGVNHIQQLDLETEKKEIVIRELKFRLKANSKGDCFICKNLGFGIFFPSYGWVTIKL